MEPRNTLKTRFTYFLRSNERGGIANAGIRPIPGALSQ
jgi:hypothetical protein